MGTTTGSELLESDEPFTKWRWRNTVENCFNTVRTAVADLQENEDAHLNEVLLCEVEAEEESDSEVEEM